MILQLLNVLIGLTLIYVIFSSVASALFEIAEGALRRRGRFLERGILEILRRISPNPAADLKRLYEHELINPLFEGAYVAQGRKLPSYIPAERFARAVLMLAEDAGAQTGDAFVRLRTYARRLIALQPPADGQTEALALETALVGYFNDSMERVSGWFRRYASGILVAIGVLLSATANVDTLQIMQTLSMDPLLADRVAESAAHYVEERNRGGAASEVADAADGDAGPGDDLETQLRTVRENRQLAESLGLPLGWRDGEFDAVIASPQAAFRKLVGLLLTALSLSFGASFWFDLLNKLVSLRTALKPPPRKTTTGSPSDVPPT